MLGFKRSTQSTSTIVFGFHCGSFIGVNPRKNQFTGQRQVGVEAINPPSLITHPSVAFRIQNPESKVGRLSSHADASIALPQNLLLPLTINRDPGNMCGDLGEPRFFRLRSPCFLAIHRKRTQYFAMRRKDRTRPAGMKSANLCKIAIIGPERIGHDVCHNDWLPCEHRSAAETVARPDWRAVHGFHISFWQIWRRAVTHMLPITV